MNIIYMIYHTIFLLASDDDKSSHNLNTMFKARISYLIHASNNG